MPPFKELSLINEPQRLAFREWLDDKIESGQGEHLLRGFLDNGNALEVYKVDGELLGVQVDTRIIHRWEKAIVSEGAADQLREKRGVIYDLNGDSV
ncbi:MAG: hypothetical protein HYT08_02415 [Candidatus Levybacteria bacterium]|nr:hypothetical protein [Candidatus Levybacteria bacterium]